MIDRDRISVLPPLQHAAFQRAHVLEARELELETRESRGDAALRDEHERVVPVPFELAPPGEEVVNGNGNGTCDVTARPVELPSGSDVDDHHAAMTFELLAQELDVDRAYVLATISFLWDDDVRCAHGTAE